MLIKPLYDAYLANADESFPLITPAEFLCLPYQIRLLRAKAKIKILAKFPPLHVLSDYKQDEIREVDEVDLGHYRQYSLLSDRRSFLSWDDVHVIAGCCPECMGSHDYMMLFPFEYQVILPEYDKA